MGNTRSSSRPLGRTVAAILAVATAACTSNQPPRSDVALDAGDESMDGSDQTPPLDVTQDVPEASADVTPARDTVATDAHVDPLGTAATMVGPDGGVLSLGELTLMVPPGALAADTEIRVTEWPPEALPADVRAQFAFYSHVYEFEPDGLQFALPLTTIFAPSGPIGGPDTTYAFWTELGTSDSFVPIGHPAASPLTAQSGHFSWSFFGAVQSAVGGYCNFVLNGQAGRPCCLTVGGRGLCGPGLSCSGGTCMPRNNCTGCMIVGESPGGVCLSGRSSRACGADGSGCLPCGAREYCSAGHCVCSAGCSTDPATVQCGLTIANDCPGETDCGTGSLCVAPPSYCNCSDAFGPSCITQFSPGTCDLGTCGAGSRTTSPCGPGQGCRANAAGVPECFDRCEGVVCTMPPNAACNCTDAIGPTCITRYPTAGTCFDGVCSYGPPTDFYCGTGQGCTTDASGSPYCYTR